MSATTQTENIFPFINEVKEVFNDVNNEPGQTNVLFVQYYV